MVLTVSKNQRVLFDDSPGLAETHAGADAWNAVKETFSKIHSHRYPDSVQSEAFIMQLVNACKIERPFIEMNKIVDFLTTNIEMINLNNPVTDFYAKRIYDCTNSANRHPEIDQTLNLPIVESITSGLIILRDNLGDDLSKHSKGKLLLNRIESHIRAGETFLLKHSQQ